MIKDLLDQAHAPMSSEYVPEDERPSLRTRELATIAGGVMTHPTNAFAGRYQLHSCIRHRFPIPEDWVEIEEHHVVVFND
jgi:hypothetical protein